MTSGFKTYLAFLRIYAIGIWTYPKLSAASPFVPPRQVLSHDSWWLTNVPCSVLVLCLWHWVSISRPSKHFPFYSGKIQINTAQFDKATNRTGTLGSASKTALNQRCSKPLIFVLLAINYNIIQIQLYELYSKTTNVFTQTLQIFYYNNNWYLINNS